jgi:hypothetical protein
MTPTLSVVLASVSVVVAGALGSAQADTISDAKQTNMVNDVLDVDVADWPEVLRVSGADGPPGDAQPSGPSAPLFGNKCAGTILVRRSKADIGPISNPTCFGDAIGAAFAWADNQISNNEVWSAQGIVAARFEHLGETRLNQPYLKALAFAPYANFDRVDNSTETTGDIDNLAYGAIFELAVGNVLRANHYFDADLEVVSSFAGEAKNWSISGAWQPYGYRSSGLPILRYFGSPIPIGNFKLVIAPSVYAEYVAELSDAAAQPIFAKRDEALRVGPAVRVSIGGFNQPGVPRWARRLSFDASYGWLYDTLSELDYELLDSTLKLGLDDAGHLNLTLSYRKGQLVETGQDVDLTQLGLSVSF